MWHIGHISSKKGKLVRKTQIVQSVMYRSDTVLITQFPYNPYHSLLVCIDLASFDET